MQLEPVVSLSSEWPKCFTQLQGFTSEYSEALFKVLSGSRPKELTVSAGPLQSMGSVSVPSSSSDPVPMPSTTLATPSTSSSASTQTNTSKGRMSLSKAQRYRALQIQLVNEFRASYMASTTDHYVWKHRQWQVGSTYYELKRHPGIRMRYSDKNLAHIYEDGSRDARAAFKLLGRPDL